MGTVVDAPPVFFADGTVILAGLITVSDIVVVIIVQQVIVIIDQIVLVEDLIIVQILIFGILRDIGIDHQQSVTVIFNLYNSPIQGTNQLQDGFGFSLIRHIFLH